MIGYSPGTDEYARATAPFNTLVPQRPALVAVPRDLDELAGCVTHAIEHGLIVVPQATGHGAAVELGADVLLVDTSGLTGIDVDPDRRTARVGAGCAWSQVNRRAGEHGLMGRSGSSPTVGVTGYTLGGGAGWLVRPYGLASAALTAVDYVDGAGRVRRASADAPDELDRDVLWACRGGGGAGVLGALEFGLVAVDELWGGFLLWPTAALDAVVDAWAGALDALGPAVSTSLGVIPAPPASFVPDSLQGKRCVHLALVSSGGAEQARSLLAAVSRAMDPVVDTLGPLDLDRLGQIHLDPPVPVPGLGIGRWLDSDSGGAVADTARAIFRAADGTPIQAIELRNVDNEAEAADGALGTVPGRFMLHAVGGPAPDGDVRPVEDALAAVAAAAAPADTGQAIASWSDGRASVADGLGPDARSRVRRIADRVDPDRVIARSQLSS